MRDHPEAFRLARWLADLLDTRLRVPGTDIRIGLDPLIGLVPGVGDMIGAVFGSLVLLLATQYRLPRIVVLRMGLNVVLNAIVGSVPVVGDLFSVWFKSNRRNVDLLERHALAGGSTAGDWAFVIGILVGVLSVIVLLLVLVFWAAGKLWHLVQQG